MNEEMKMILEMVEQGKITPDEAMELMQRLEKDAETEKNSPTLVKTQPNLSKRKLYVNIAENGKKTVKVALPFRMIRAGFNIAKAVGPRLSEDAKVLEKIDMEELLRSVNDMPEGEKLTIAEIEEDGRQIEVYVQ